MSFHRIDDQSCRYTSSCQEKSPSLDKFSHLFQHDLDGNDKNILKFNTAELYKYIKPIMLTQVINEESGGAGKYY